MLEKFILNTNNIMKSSYIWNMVGGLINSFQSVCVLMVLTRILDAQQAGIYTLAYANANLFMAIGKYGVRNFQASDTRNEYTFGEYWIARIITICIMLLSASISLVHNSKVNGYSLDKSIIMALMYIFKIPDVFEDVYYGEYQRQGRLDIAAKALTVRITSTIVMFLCCIGILKNQKNALIISIIYTFGVMGIILKIIKKNFDFPKRYCWRNVKTLIYNCTPLFLGTFFSLYIGNAPKYAIDKYLSDEMQACYGFIAMPVFVIGMVNGFIFNPALNSISEIWNSKEKKHFLYKVIIQVIYVILITVICLLAGYWLGVPILSLLYNTDLSNYRKELVILLLGGGFLALSGLLNAIITIMRLQKHLVWGYGIISLLALLFSDYFVRTYNIYGAAILYAYLMFGLSICFIIVFFAGFLKTKNK